ncbi:GNAT family acetyltransferase [Bacillus safensis]|uniref:GNAT family N-acetyltransferase n=1 Tax=Bacillus TaxID=1386 RepID=UPI00148EBDE8|nr:GNAT family acetyltransferase [Bacillus safensis]MBG9824085.1 GNAT family acetyltransferase [Bacillus safensis]MBG9832701.1 GNAT family acetyltransferase [Bacillus safensis]MBG9859798.1 GNAT family acetyltransferase [Bacillus safensis]MBG9897672.1 GNAT family acetyltransferase [Bacillus safensis]
MHLLKQQKTPSMKKGIRQIDPAYPVFVDAVMDGMIQGHLYVDDEVHPLVYFLEASCGIYYVSGRSEAELLRCSAFIVDVYERQKRQNGRFTLFSANPLTDAMMKKCLGLHLNEMERHAYVYSQAYSHATQPHPGYRVERTNEQVMTASSAFPSSYYEAYWGETARFLSKGIGIAILNGENVVSECVSIFSSMDRAEIDIWTDESYRGKGLALLSAQHMISTCLEKKRTPHWDCDVHHLASIKLAEKLGFQRLKTYRLFYGSR